MFIPDYQSIDLLTFSNSRWLLRISELQKKEDLCLGYYLFPWSYKPSYSLNFMCHDGRRESEIVLEKRKKLLIIVCLLTNVDFYLWMLKLVPLAVNRILLKVKLI